MSLLAIDPGSEKSGWVVLSSGGEIQEGGVLANETLREYLLDWDHEVVIEKMMCYGKPVGAEVFTTIYWSGIFMECVRRRGSRVTLIPRSDVVKWAGAKGDANLRAAVIKCQNWGGTKYPISTHAWQAAAVGLTHLRIKNIATEKHVEFGVEE